jgi:hypothetical protein
MCPKRFSAVVKVSGQKIEVPKEPIPVVAGKAKGEAKTSDNP